MTLDSCWLLLGKVFASCFALWRNCYFPIRIFMMYCCSMCDHDALMSVLCFIDTFVPKHVDMFMELGFRLRTSEVWAWGSWYVHFASCFHVDIYCFMGCYITLWYHIYAFSLLFCKVYLKRENSGSRNSGLEKEQILVHYSAHLQMP